MPDGSIITEPRLSVQIEPLLVRRVDAAKLLAVSPRVFDDLARAGLIGKTKIGGTVLFDVDELRAFVRQAKIEDYSATAIAELVEKSKSTRNGWRGRSTEAAAGDG